MTSQETLVWTSPSQTSADLDTWNLTCVDLPDQTTLRAKFTATRSEQTVYGVDMAIDDVRLNPARCDGRLIKAFITQLFIYGVVVYVLLSHESLNYCPELLPRLLF